MPPLPLLLAYRFLGWRLGPRYRDWVHSDITRKGYVLRQGLPVALALGALLAVVFAASGSDPQRVLFPVLAALVLFVLLRKNLQDRALRQQGLTWDGEVDPSARHWYDDPERLQRRNAVGTAWVVALVGAAFAVMLTGPEG